MVRTQKEKKTNEQPKEQPKVPTSYYQRDDIESEQRQIASLKQKLRASRVEQKTEASCSADQFLSRY